LQKQDATVDLNDFRYFVLIVDHGGYTAAERLTHIHRSKLSRRIALLEERLGVRLLQRSTRRLSLTEAGQVFYDHSKAMLIEAEAAQEAVELLRSEPTGVVRVSCPVVMAQFYIAQLIANFMVANPKVRVELDATDRTVSIIDERFDIALRARAMALHEPGLVARQVATGRFILVASPGYLEGRGAIRTPAQLSGHDTVGPLSAGTEQTWVLTDAEGTTEKVPLRPRLLCSDLSVQYQAAISGVGIALLPQRIAARGLKYGALVHVADEWSTPEEGIHLVIACRRGLLPSVRALVDYLMERLPPALAE
jgi:DNA-binding transcriptional LysR family regulator